jgi:hypothetical protein
MVNQLVVAPSNAKLFFHDRRSKILLSLDSTTIIFSLGFPFEFKSMKNLKTKIPSHHPIDLSAGGDFLSTYRGC